MDWLAFVPQFGGVLVTVLAFVAALTIIVFVHEFGHYIVARWAGIRADVFSLGFGPVLFSRADRFGTRWQVAAVPLGGFVKFEGDRDIASSSGSAHPGSGARHAGQTLQGARLPARVATVAAGPAFNFALSILVFAGLMMVRGQAVDPLTVGALTPFPGPTHELQVGDEILAIEGVPLTLGRNDSESPPLRDLPDALPARGTLEYSVRRNGNVLTVGGPFPWPPHVAGVSPRGAAVDAGIRKGDVIVEVDSRPIHTFNELKRIVEESGGRPLRLSVWRDGSVYEVMLVPRRTDEPLPDGGFQTQWRIGIVAGLAFEPATEPVGLWTAALGGVRETLLVVEGTLSGLGHILTGAISTCNLSGPIGIAETSGTMASQGAYSFIAFVAVLSTAIGLINLFPIPVLDGGHLVFFAYEAITGRPPPERLARWLTTLGVVLMLALIVFVTGLDLFC